MAHDNRNVRQRQIGIIADDLTGAGDSGIQFSEKGLETTIIFDVKGTDGTIGGEDVVILNTESRSLPKKQAYDKTYECASFLKKSNITHLYKKIDSTLRGNWAAEVQAAADVYQPDFIIVAPAFPEMGRTTINGRQLLQGHPLEQTQLADDPKTPVSQSDIAEILKQQINQAHIEKIVPGEWGPDTVRWEEKLRELHQTGVNWLVFDAENDADLEQMAKQLAKTDYRFLWVGSAGLAKFLPDALKLVNHKQTRSIHYHDSPVLIVAGSTSDITKKQILTLTESPGIDGIEIDPMIIFNGQLENIKQEIAGNACKNLTKNRDVVLHTGSSRPQMDEVFLKGTEQGFSRSEISSQISAQLGSIAKLIMDQYPIRNMILTGGDTAKDVYRCLGFAGMKLIKEIEAGIPLGQFIGDLSMNVVTKAGAFGSERSLVHAVNCLKKGCLE